MPFMRAPNCATGPRWSAKSVYHELYGLSIDTECTPIMWSSVSLACISVHLLRSPAVRSPAARVVLADGTASTDSRDMDTSEPGLDEQEKALRDKNRLLKRLLAAVSVILVGVSMALAVKTLSSIRKTQPAKPGLLRQGTTMLEVEQLLGKPDRIEVKEGGVEGAYERPKVISWIYAAYRLTDSDEAFGRPGHINFIPLRFTERG